MIVHLRGDEDHAADFTIDADAAMQQLGIKRSRLTQISGKDLRVGRIRKDRYIRPVYRLSDLNQYLDWTRATATSKSSSEAVKQSLEDLESGIETRIKGQLDEHRRQLQQRLRQSLDAALNRFW